MVFIVLSSFFLPVLRLEDVKPSYVLFSFNMYVLFLPFSFCHLLFDDTAKISGYLMSIKGRKTNPEEIFPTKSGKHLPTPS
jgi:hypothetical protein